MSTSAPTLLQTALKCLVERRYGHNLPKGTRNPDGVWIPIPTERQNCCVRLALISPQWPDVALVHCYSITHVANLFGVPRAALVTALKLWLGQNTLQKKGPTPK
jgi:hypothetical protein